MHGRNDRPKPYIAIAIALLESESKITAEALLRKAGLMVGSYLDEVTHRGEESLLAHV